MKKQTTLARYGMGDGPHELPRPAPKRKAATLLDFGFPPVVVRDAPGRVVSGPPRRGGMSSDIEVREVMRITLGVVGSRTIPEDAAAIRVIRSVVSALQKSGELVVGEICSGGARGADRCARRFAMASPEIDLKECEPKGSMKEDYFARNEQIVQHSDVLLALWDGASTGTANALMHARKKGLPTYVVKFEHGEWGLVERVDEAARKRKK